MEIADIECLQQRETWTLDNQCNIESLKYQTTNIEILITLLKQKNIFSEENNIGVFGDNDRCDRKMSRILWKCVQTMVEYPIAVQRSLNLGEQNREN